MEDLPRVFLMDAEPLLWVRSRVFIGEDRFAAADERLLERANDMLGVGPYSVVDKVHRPPSGDRRDYMSLAPDWLPDPAAENGLPYLHSDGQRNEECEEYDYPRLVALCSAVNTLSTAYFFSDYEDFAERAALLLRTFFLDEERGMNPHLEFAQAIKGKCDGRPAGLIETAGFSWLVDHIGLLAHAPSWNGEDQFALENWFGLYLDWLLNSQHGVEERRQTDSHGTLYDVQVAAIALFCRREAAARQAVERGMLRIFQQIDAGGCQPQEMDRALALDHCVMNMSAFFDLADLGRHVGLDVWSGSEGERLRQAFVWLVENGFDRPRSLGDQAAYTDQRWVPLLLRGAVRMGDVGCQERLAAMGDEVVQSDWTTLFYPQPDA